MLLHRVLLTPHSLCRLDGALSALEHVHGLQQLLGVSAAIGLVVQTLVDRLLLHLLHRHVVLGVNLPVAFGAAADQRAAVAGALAAVAAVGVGAGVLVLDHHQVARHLLELVDEPLSFYFSQDASLVVISAGEAAKSSLTAS